MTQSNLAIAIYPGTFDPITLGHENIAHRATRIFDKVIVAVASNSSKQCFFSFEERVGLVKAVFKEYKEIEAVSYTHLTLPTICSV